MAGAEEDDSGARARALALLEATHRFPGDYPLTVITENREGVGEDVRRAVIGSESVTSSGISVSAYVTQSSQSGKYVSHRLTVTVRDAAEVLEIYARMREVAGVVKVL